MAGATTAPEPAPRRPRPPMAFTPRHRMLTRGPRPKVPDPFWGLDPVVLKVAAGLSVASLFGVGLGGAGLLLLGDRLLSWVRP